MAEFGYATPTLLPATGDFAVRLPLFQLLEHVRHLGGKPITYPAANGFGHAETCNLPTRSILRDQVIQGLTRSHLTLNSASEFSEKAHLTLQELHSARDSVAR